MSLSSTSNASDIDAIISRPFAVDFFARAFAALFFVDLFMGTSFPQRLTYPKFLASIRVRTISKAPTSDMMPEVKNATVRLVLSLHEPRFYREQGRNWLERLLIRFGFVPPYRTEEEIGSVWVAPGNSTDDYETEGIEVTGPLPGATARQVLDRLRLAFESLGFTVITETDYP